MTISVHHEMNFPCAEQKELQFEKKFRYKKLPIFTSVEKSELLVVEQNEFEYLETSKLMSISGVFGLSGRQRKYKYA